MISNEKAIDAMLSLIELQTNEDVKSNIRDVIIQLLCQENESVDQAWEAVIRDFGSGNYKPKYRRKPKDDE